MWDVTIEPRASVARCYECGSSPVFALCHHCWRPGCKKHVRPSPRWARKIRREGRGPGLAKAPVYHCGGCAHRKALTAGTTWRWLVIVLGGAALAVAGIVTVRLSLTVGAILLLTGGLSALVAMLHVWRGVARARTPLPVPLLPKAVDVELTEELRGEITLEGEGDEYRTVLEPVKGELSVRFTFGGPDRERMRRRRKRARTADAAVPRTRQIPPVAALACPWRSGSAASTAPPMAGGTLTGLIWSTLSGTRSP